MHGLGQTRVPELIIQLVQQGAVRAALHYLIKDLDYVNS